VSNAEFNVLCDTEIGHFGDELSRKLITLVLVTNLAGIKTQKLPRRQANWSIQEKNTKTYTQTQA